MSPNSLTESSNDCDEYLLDLEGTAPDGHERISYDAHMSSNAHCFELVGDKDFPNFR